MKNKTIEKYKGGVFFRIILVLTMLFLLLSAAFSVKFIAGSGFNGLHSLRENFAGTFPNVNVGLMSLLIVVIEMAVMLFFIISMNRFLRQASDRAVTITVIVIWAIMIALQLFIIFSMNPAPSVDSFRLLNRSYAIASGEITKGQYDLPSFKRFSNNDFSLMLMVGFFRLVLPSGIGTFALYKLLIVLNALFMDLGILFAALTIRLLRGRRAAASLTSFVAMNPLYYLMVFWVYTNTVSLFPMMLTVFLLALFEKKRDTWPLWRQLAFMAATGLVAAVSYSIRATGFFPIIAYIIWRVILLIRRNTDTRHILSTVILVLTSAVFITVFSNASAQYNPDKSGNFPLIHWVKVGTTGDGQVNGHDLDVLDKVKGKDAKAAYEKDLMKREFTERGTTGNVKFLLKKTGVTWSKAESDYRKRMMPFENNTRIVGAFLLGDKDYLVTTYLYAYRLLLFIMALAGGVVFFIKKADGTAQTIVYSIFGGYLFYTFWEGKPCYSFPFLILIEMMALPAVLALGERSSEKKAFDLRCAVPVCLLCIIVAAGVQNYKVNRSGVIYQQSINAYTGNKERHTIDSGSTLTQEFSPRYGFNHISLRVFGLDSKSAGAYRFRILSGNQVVVENPDYAVNDHSLGLHFDEIVPEKGQKFTIEVTNEDGDTSGVWMTSYTRSFRLYRGRTTINGDRVNGNLNIKVDKVK
ncbi:MAG: hypothetical protein II133_01870 [Lachnospiraceae bacterium]|nr:hypothetical protein [Lachnospiraceae bacterium]